MLGWIGVGGGREVRAMDIGMVEGLIRERERDILVQCRSLLIYIFIFQSSCVILYKRNYAMSYVVLKYSSARHQVFHQKWYFLSEKNYIVH